MYLPTRIKWNGIQTIGCSLAPVKLSQFSNQHTQNKKDTFYVGWLAGKKTLIFLVISNNYINKNFD